MIFGPPRARPDDLRPLPAPAPRLQPNGLPALPVLDRIA
jgi:hypothetical protein